MTLTVVVGDQRATRRVSGLKIKASSPGGFESVEFNVARKLDRSLFDQFTDVLVYDAATGEQVGGGRLMDQGRNDDGTWSVSCIGEGFASTTDRTEPYILVDRSLDGWFQSYAPNTRFKVQSAQDGLQYGVPDAGLAFTVDAGNWAINRFLRATYPLLARSGQLVGGLLLTTKAAVNDAGPRTQVLANNPFFVNAPLDAAWSTASTALAFWCGTHFPADRTELSIQINASAGAMGGGDNVWLLASNIVVLAQRLDRNRAAITGAVYSSGKVTLDQAFIDVIARFCPRLDLAAGTIDAGTYQYDQLAWFDGISPKAVLDDMLNLEPTFSWHVWGKGPNGWETELVQTPTEVRYEASTVDGFSAPSPSLEVYNSVDVRWRDVIGQVQVTTVTSPVPALDEAGITRSTTLDLADELGSAAQATARGLTFLGDHAVPPNAGTLTVARRIYDGRTGRWVHPWNIRPGSLIRVRGIQPTPDTLNTTSPDGVTIFRIVVATYDEDSRTAVLELDTYSLDQQQAIASLFKRSRKR
jgi:hypothetical protein